LLLGIAAALVASYFAARRVAALEPIEVVRGEESRPQSAHRPALLVCVWLVLVAISAAAIILQVKLRSVALGNFGATLWNASVIVISVPLVHWSAGLLSLVLPRFFGAEGRVAVESLLRARTRAGVTVAAIALVVTIGLVLSSIALSFRLSMKDYIGRLLAADLSVSAVTSEGGWLETPIPEELSAEIGGIPGIRSVEALRVLPGQMYRGDRISIAGLDGSFFDPARVPDYWYREGDAVTACAALRANIGVHVSTELAERADLHVGDTIALDSPTGEVVMPIVGVVPDYMSDRGGVIVNRRLLTDRWGERAVNRIHVMLEPEATADEVRARILERLGARFPLKVLSLSEVLRYHDQKIDSAFAFTHAIQLLIIIVTVAGIFDLLVSAIIGRRRELAIWRLIGADDAAVRRSIVIESVTIGALGAALGVLVGVVTAWIWTAINFRYLLGYYLERHFALGAAAWYVLVVLATTLLAGYAAARFATRQSIIASTQTG